MIFGALGYFALGEFDDEGNAPIVPEIILFPSYGARRMPVRRKPLQDDEPLLIWYFMENME